jgi:hypothetical protein
MYGLDPYHRVRRSVLRDGMSERFAGALLERLTHHALILEMNAPSYSLAQSRARKAQPP